jgi:Holliday junction DNA helicase RuvB
LELTVLNLLSEDPELERLLLNIVEWEKGNPPRADEPYPEFHGFEWHMVHGDPRTLNKLVTKGILNIAFKSNKSTIYRLANLEATERALADYHGTQIQEETVSSPLVVPDLFKIIVGHEDKKDILLRSIMAERPVSCLLYGSPASAKTLILEELARLPKSYFLLGSNLSKAGLFEVLFNERPRYLILDELDKIDDSDNLSCLLSLMERGRVTETKYRRHRSINLKTWVFASANSIIGIPAELLSRFLKLRFKDYTPDEFLEVAVTVLKEREGVQETLALYIADRVLKNLQSRDVRDAVRLSRLLKENTKSEVDLLIEMLRKQV